MLSHEWEGRWGMAMTEVESGDACKWNHSGDPVFVVIFEDKLTQLVFTVRSTRRLVTSRLMLVTGRLRFQIVGKHRVCIFFVGYCQETFCHAYCTMSDNLGL